MSSPLVNDCIHGNAGLHCQECGLNLNSNDSMKVHNMFSHNQNNSISWRGSAGGSDIDNNNQPKKIGNTIAAADSSDKQPATPTGPSTSIEHPATPQSYHSAPSPYQQAGAEMQQYSPGPFGYEYYGLTVEGMAPPVYPEYIKADLMTKYDNKDRSNRYMPYQFSSSVSSSTPNNPMLASQPTPSPSPKQCEQCGFLCESEGQLSEHSASVHKTVDGGLQQFHYPHPHPHPYTIQKESTAAQFLDLDSQRVISKDDSDKKNPVPLVPTTQASLHWPNHLNHTHNLNIPHPHPAQPATIDQRAFHSQEPNKIYMYDQKFASDPKQFPQQAPDVKSFQMELKSFAPPQDNKAPPYQPEKMFQQDGKHFPQQQQQQHNEHFEQMDVKLFAEPQKQQIIYHQQTDAKMFSPNPGVPAPVSASVPGPGPGPAQPPLMASPPDFPTTTTPQDPPYRSFEPAGPQISSSHTTTTKGAAWKSNEARRPKTYNCTACNKWFTSSGHLKRHYNTTLHKNAVKTSGQPDPATLPISSHHHPGRDPNHPSHKNPQSTSPQASVPAEPPTRSPEPQGFAQQHYLPPQTLGFGHPQGYQHIQGYVQTPMGQQPSNLVPPPGPSLGAPPGPLHSLNPHPSTMLTQHFVENPPNGQAGPSAINTQQLRGLQTTLPPITQSTQILSSYNNHLMGTTQEHHQAMELGPATMGRFQVIPPHTDMPMPIQNYLHTIGDRPRSRTTVPLPSFSVLQPSCSLDGLTGQDNMQPGPHNTYSQVNHMMLDYQHQPSHTPELVPLPHLFVKSEPVEYIVPDYDALTTEDNSMGYGTAYTTLTKVENLSPCSDSVRTSSNFSENSSQDVLDEYETEPLRKVYSPKLKPTELSQMILDELKKQERKKDYCNICKKGFNKPCYLTQHNKRFHNGELPYKCEQCGKRFRTLKIKNMHVERHDPSKKAHQCDQCVKVFNHKSDLTRHKHIHTGRRNFHCAHCKRGFNRHDHMVKHGNTHYKKGIVMRDNKVVYLFDVQPGTKKTKRCTSKRKKERRDSSSEL